MYSVSSNFNDLAFSASRTVYAKATVNGVSITNDDIISISFDEAVADTDIGIGNTISNTLKLKMYKKDNVSYTNVLVLPLLSFDGTEWCPLGTFRTVSATSEDNYKTVELTCYDEMAFLNDSYEPTVTLPASCEAVMNDIATQYDIDVVETTYPTGNLITSSEYSVREMIGFVAGLLGKNAKFNRDGELEFIWFKSQVTLYGDAYGDGQINQTDVDYITANELNVAVTLGASSILGQLTVNEAYMGFDYKAAAYPADVNDDNVVTASDVAEIQAYVNGTPYTGSKVGTVKRSGQKVTGYEIYMDGLNTALESYTISCLVSGTSENVIQSGEGKAITFSNPFMTQAILDDIADVILPFSYTSLSCTYRGNPAYETGDLVTILDEQNNELTVPITNQTMTVEGGLKAEISSAGLTDEQALIGDIKTTEVKKVEAVAEQIAQKVQEINDSLLSGTDGYMVLDEEEIDGVKRLVGFKIMDTPTVTSTTKGWQANKNGIGWSSNGFTTISKVGLDMANGAIYADNLVAGAVLSNYLTASNLHITGGALDIRTSTDDSNIIVLSSGTGSGSTFEASYESILKPNGLSIIRTGFFSCAITPSSIKIKSQGISPTEETTISSSSISSNSFVEDGTSLSSKYEAKGTCYKSGDTPYFNKVWINSPGSYAASATNAKLYPSGSSYQVVLDSSDSSARRFKHDITTELKPELDPHGLYDVDVVQFKFNDDHLGDDDTFKGKDLIGLIAEDVYEHFPIGADADADGICYNWNYRFIIPAMLKLIQEQHEQIEELKSRVETLEKGV